MATLKRSSKRSAPARRPVRRPARPVPPLEPHGQSARGAKSRARASGPSRGTDPRLAEGLALFNHRQFFACHEALERVWLSTAGRDRDFYKGLIQAAVACYHWSRGNLGGAMSLYRSSNRYLAKYRPDYLGVDVGGFLQRYTELFRWLRRHRTRYEPRLVPMIAWIRRPLRA